MEEDAALGVAAGDNESTVFHRDAGRFRYHLVVLPEGDHWRWKVSRANISGVDQVARDLNTEGGTGTAPTLAAGMERGKDWLNRFINREDRFLVRNRLRIRVRTEVTPVVEGGLWVGIAGSAVGQKAFLTAQELVCPTHNQRPQFDRPGISKTGEWNVDTRTCCAEFFDTVRKALVRIGGT